MESSGALETKQDAGKGVSGEVKRWLLEIQLADKQEERWRKDVEQVLKVYRSDNYYDNTEAKRKETFNILWSNTEIKRPSLYNSTPRPDIRRRYKDKDPIGKAVSELMERSSSYTLDCNDFDDLMALSVNDMLLPGRAVDRVRYEPTLTESQDEVAYEEITFEHVQWDEFSHGPGKTWKKVPWIKFDHKLTKEQIKEKFPGFEDVVSYDCSIDDQKDMDESDTTVFKRCKVYEIWDDDEKKVRWLAPSYKDKFLRTDDDPLGLKDFFPIPRPLYAIESSTTLVPMPEYMMYETLAKELEHVTNRIRRILGGLRLRGIYDSTIGELEKLFDESDNAFIAAENVSALLERGGLDNAIWMLPIKEMAEILKYLYEYRVGLIQQIYEITGISDILRGATDPNETLGAQEIKANFGTQRLQRQQRDVQRYARDLIRISVEIMSEHFSRETLSQMSGLNFPTKEQQAIARIQLQFVGPQQQPPDPRLQEVLNKPTWEQIEQILKSDMLREYRVDIETDSTVESDLQQDKKNMVELVKGIVEYFQGMAEPVASGVVTVDIAKKILMPVVRRFKLGREVEDALEELQQPQPQQQPNMEQIVAQKEQEFDAERQQLKAANDKEKVGLEYDKRELQLQQKAHELTMRESDVENREKGNEQKEAEMNNSEFLSQQQALIQQQSETMLQAVQALAQLLPALTQAVQTMSAPRETELVRDERGRPTGAISKPVTIQ